MPGIAELGKEVGYCFSDLKKHMKVNEEFDAIVIVYKSTDYRATPQEFMTTKTLKTLFKGLDPKQLFVIITHCDALPPTEDWIREKNLTFDLGLLRENTFLFNKTVKPLADFIRKVTSKKAH